MDQSEPSIPAEERLDPEFLRGLARARMPFGKYRGSWLTDLPEAYLTWFSQQGWPAGLLGRQLASMYEIKINGLEPIVRQVRAMDSGPL